MSERTLPPILTEPAVAAVRALNADPVATTYLAIAISAVRARDEETRRALEHLAVCPALEGQGETPEAMRATFRLAARLLFGVAD